MSVLAIITLAVLGCAALAYAYWAGASAGIRSMRPAQDYLLEQVRRLQDEASSARAQPRGCQPRLGSGVATMAGGVTGSTSGPGPGGGGSNPSPPADWPEDVLEDD